MAQETLLKKEENSEEVMHFFIARKDKKTGDFVVYASERYRFTEYELLSIIKILLADRRNVSVGRRIMWAYQDSTNYSEKAYKNLKEIGIQVEKNEIEIATKKKSKVYCI